MKVAAVALYVFAYFSAVIDGAMQPTGLYPDSTPAGSVCVG
jgi:hypothetical protein